MIYGKHKKHSLIPGGFFHLEEEGTKTRVFGYGHGDSIKLKDEYGNVWQGSAVRSDDNSRGLPVSRRQGKDAVRGV